MLSAIFISNLALEFKLQPTTIIISFSNMLDWGRRSEGLYLIWRDQVPCSWWNLHARICWRKQAGAADATPLSNPRDSFQYSHVNWVHLSKMGKQGS